GESIQEIRRMIERGDLTQGAGSVDTYDVVTPYVDEIAAQFSHGPYQLKRRVKVVFDAGNGTAGPVIKRIIDKLDLESTELFFDMDGRFPNHHPDPTVPKNLQLLVDKVLEKKVELGIAFDGDADRIGAVDEHGNAIYGDMLLLIFGREILTR